MFAALRLSCILLALLSLASIVDAQTGTPQFGSLESGGFDVINHQDLNVNFTIPAVSKPGRGIPVSLAINYNSTIWTPVTPVSTTTWAPASGYGWSYPSPVGSLTWTYSSDNDCGVGSKEYFYTNYAYTEPNGTVHPFNLFIIVNSQCNAGARTGYATDASGYWIDATVPAAPIVYGPDGMKKATGAPALTDSNGNLLTMSSPGGGEQDFTDTTGQIVLKQIPGTGYTDFKYQDTTGTWQTLHLITQNFNIKTAFACPNIGEYTSTSAVALPTELDLPNNTKYLFTYEATPGASGYVTGRVQRVTLPTGGYYEYTYPGANDGNACVTGTASFTRKINDGSTTNTWTYVNTKLSSSSWKTAVTPPTLPYDSATNIATYFFNSLGQETSRNFYQGAESPSNLLRTINTTWATNKTPASQATILENNQQSQVQTDYDSNGMLLETREYDLGTGAPGGLVRRTTYTYTTIGHIINHVASRIVKDGSGTIQSRTVFGYDEGGAFTGSNCITGAAQHDDTNFGCSFTARGNQTSATTYTDPVTPSGAITKSFTFDSLGNLRTAQVNCCQLKTFSYSATTSYAYPDSVTSGSSSPQLATSATYNSYTGLTATTTDENSQQTSLAYDSEKRLITVTRPDSTQLTYSYDDVARTVTSITPITASSSAKQIASADGLGRPIKSQTTDGSGTSYSISETQYDTLGRPYKTSNPHNSTAQYWTETRFDGMGRQTKTILQDNSQTLFAYAGPAVTVTDPAAKQRKMQYDGLGRLLYLWEPDPANGNSLTLQTSYAYTTLDGLSSVAQGAQTRTYSYDALGRLSITNTPEAGTVCFGTLSGSTCQANGYDSYDNLLYRTDARGVVTNYLYDSLNRLVGLSYPTVPGGVSAMPNVCKVNGSATNNANICYTYGTSSANLNNGRLVSITDPSGSETYSYNNLGQTTQLQKIVGSTSYTMGYQYNLAGETTTITYPSGRAINQNVDVIGRLSSIVGTLNSVNTTYASGFAYNTAFQAVGFQYGNNLYVAFGFSADRLQLNCLDYATTNRNGACSHDATTKFGLGYSYSSAGSNNGQVSGVSDSVDNGRSATYSYDALYRLTSAVTTGSTGYPKWGLSMTYDRYGNRTAQTVTAGTGPSNSVAVSATTNRITTSGYSYDANGNMTNDGANTLVYDGENRVTSSSGSGAGAYTYDGNGLRVKKVSGSTTTVYVFSGSKVIAEYDNGAGVTAPSREYIYSGGALLAKIDSSGTKYYHQDQLSNRLVTDSSANISAQLGHYPLGESWYNSSNDKLAFTSYERDSESGNDYAMARFNTSRLGRFLSPDPVRGNIANPQSLNRFSYTHNDPINFVDPSGMFVAPQLYAAVRALGASMVGSLWNEFALMDVQRIGTMYHFEFNAGYTPFGGWNVSSLLADAAYGEGGVTYTTSPMYGGIPPLFAGKVPRRSLMYDKVAGGKDYGFVAIKWRLSRPSTKGGYIVQHVTDTDPSGKVLVDQWEAWQVKADKEVTTLDGIYPYDDIWFDKNSGDSVKAEARFYEGLELPAIFTIDQSGNGPAGDLPFTTIDPHLPTAAATSPVSRTFTFP